MADSNSDPFFDERVTIRLRRNMVDKVLKAFNANQDKYDSACHYIRAAIADKLRKDGYKPKIEEVTSLEVKE